MHYARRKPGDVSCKHVNLVSKRIYGFQYLLRILFCHFDPVSGTKYASPYAAEVSSASASSATPTGHHPRIYRSSEEDGSPDQVRR